MKPARGLGGAGIEQAPPLYPLSAAGPSPFTSSQIVDRRRRVPPQRLQQLVKAAVRADRGHRQIAISQTSARRAAPSGEGTRRELVTFLEVDAEEAVAPEGARLDPLDRRPGDRAGRPSPPVE